MAFQFTCSCCGNLHVGMPAFDAAAPLSYYVVPEAERASRCELGSDDCIIDGQYFFVRGCIEVPVHGEDEPFSWGVWVSLSRSSYEKWRAVFAVAKRSHIGPFFGWLNVNLEPYPTEESIKPRFTCATMAFAHTSSLNPPSTFWQSSNGTEYLESGRRISTSS